MLIDVNSFIGHWPFRQVTHNTCGSRVQLMRQFGIDISVISSLNGVFYKNSQSANEELYKDWKSSRKFESKLIPFAVINPIYAGWKDDLEKSVGQMGMRGVRIHPLYHHYDLNNKNCIDLVKRTRDLGLPVAFSLRIVDKRVSSWMDINEEWSLKDVLPIIKEVPDAKYMILNLVNSLELSDDEKSILKKADILMDTSGRALTHLEKLLPVYGNDKFGYGTNSPILEPFTGLLRIESLKPEEAGESTKDLLRYGNAKKILNL